MTGVVNGDVLAAQKPAAAAPRPAPAPAAAPSGGLDFSSLLAAAPPTPAAASASPPQPVYYPGMSLDDAMINNPHPQAFVSLLLSKDHLFKGA